jgi:2-polyprenyl-3-methyl-5-hydroxy-6-metoxy-1,4-benzoquinol methylase
MPIFYWRLPIFLPSPFVQPLKNLRNRIKKSPATSGNNLLGDRDVEWSWIVSQMPDGPGLALDFGSGGSPLSLSAAMKGFTVKAVDLEERFVPYFHNGIQTITGDIFSVNLSENQFDLVINCSAVEHIGLAGRYGVDQERPDGDIEFMSFIKSVMKPGAVMLLTIPVGRDAVFSPLTRVYGTQRLPRLLEGFAITAEQYWTKNAFNQWILSDKHFALLFEASSYSFDPLKNRYALGCFVLIAQ